MPSAYCPSDCGVNHIISDMPDFPNAAEQSEGYEVSYLQNVWNQA